MKIRALCILLCFCIVTANAQFKQGNQEISFGIGGLTSEQMFDGDQIGILSPSLKQYTNNSVSGIWFADYKYFVSKRLTVGLFAGIENESGDWNYFYDQGTPDDEETLKKGTFTRTAYTIAPEISFVYTNQKDVRIYSTLGIGATFKNEMDTYDTGYYNQGYYNGKNIYGNSRSAPNELWKFNAYYSPIGMSFGGRVRGFFELGIGYKGVFNCGISYKLNTVIKSLRGLSCPSANPVIILPYDFPTGNELRYMEPVSSGSPGPHKKADFDQQLDKVASTIIDDGGNVFKISRVRGNEIHEKYSVGGQAYYAANYDSFKTKVANRKKEDFKNENCAYLVIYSRNMGLLHKAALSINDTNDVVIENNSTYKLKITTEGKCKIVSDMNTITLDLKPGNYYYLKTYAYHFKTGVSIVDNRKGALESSVNNQHFEHIESSK